MASSEGLQKAGQVNIEQLKLINCTDIITDLTEFLVELNIFEDIFSNYLYGNIILTDSRNLIEKLNINLKTDTSFELGNIKGKFFLDDGEISAKIDSDSRSFKGETLVAK